MKIVKKLSPIMESISNVGKDKKKLREGFYEGGFPDFTSFMLVVYEGETYGDHDVEFPHFPKTVDLIDSIWKEKYSDKETWDKIPFTQEEKDKIFKSAQEEAKYWDNMDLYNSHARYNAASMAQIKKAIKDAFNIENKYLHESLKKKMDEDFDVNHPIGVLPHADAVAMEQHIADRAAGLERRANPDKDPLVKELIDETASEKSRTLHYDVVDRKGLAKILTEAKKNKCDFKVGRSDKAGYRYFVDIIPIYGSKGALEVESNITEGLGKTKGVIKESTGIWNRYDSKKLNEINESEGLADDDDGHVDEYRYTYLPASEGRLEFGLLFTTEDGEPAHLLDVSLGDWYETVDDRLVKKAFGLSEYTTLTGDNAKAAAHIIEDYIEKLQQEDVDELLVKLQYKGLKESVEPTTGIEKELKDYIKWCEDNKKEAKDAKSLKQYVDQLKTPGKSLTEASTAEKRSFKQGGEATGDLIQGKAIARVKDPQARQAAVAAVRAGRPDVAKQFYGDRKEDQAFAANDKKMTKMQKRLGDMEESLDEDLQLYASSLKDFKPAKEAEPLWNEIIEKGKLDDLEYELENVFKSDDDENASIDIEGLNDLLVNHPDFIRTLIGLDDAPLEDDDYDDEDIDPVDNDDLIVDDDEDEEPVEDETPVESEDDEDVIDYKTDKIDSDDEDDIEPLTAAELANEEAEEYPEAPHYVDEEPKEEKKPSEETKKEDKVEEALGSKEEKQKKINALRAKLKEDCECDHPCDKDPELKLDDEEDDLKEDWEDYDTEEGWTEEDIAKHKEIDWKERDYKDFDAGDEFKGDVYIYKYNAEPEIKKDITFHKFLSANAIYPPYYRPVDFEPTDLVGPMYDGRKHDNYDVHDRYEDQEAYNLLSEDIIKQDDNGDDLTENIADAFVKSRVTEAKPSDKQAEYDSLVKKTLPLLESDEEVVDISDADINEMIGAPTEADVKKECKECDEKTPVEEKKPLEEACEEKKEEIKEEVKPTAEEPVKEDKKVEECKEQPIKEECKDEKTK